MTVALRTDKVTSLGQRLAGEHEDLLPGCYNELRTLIRGYLRGRVPTADVDDVSQVVLVEVWRHRSRYDPQRSLEAWVLTIARRRSIDYLRSRRPENVPLQDIAARAGTDGREVATRVERARDLRQLLAQLPGPQREAIEMAYFADLTQRQIADQLQVPLGTIKARTARGLRSLRALIISPATI